MLHGRKKDIEDIQDREIRIFVFGFEGMIQRMKSGSMVKRLRHRPFTAVTGVQIPLESFAIGSSICRCGSIGRAADL